MALFGYTLTEGNTLSIREIFRNIESHDLAADLNLALNLSRFFKIANEQESVQNLKSLIKDLKNINIILLRIKWLTEEKVDLRYENPNDTAITIYTWVLLSEHTQAGKIAAEYAINLRQGWWAIKYARNVLNEARQSSSTGHEDVKTDALSTIEVDEAGEILIYFAPSTKLISGIHWNLGSPQGTIIANVRNPWKDKPEIRFEFGSFDMIQWFPMSGLSSQELANFPVRALAGQPISLLPEYN